MLFTCCCRFGRFVNSGSEFRQLHCWSTPHCETCTFWPKVSALRKKFCNWANALGLEIAIRLKRGPVLWEITRVQWGTSWTTSIYIYTSTVTPQGTLPNTRCLHILEVLDDVRHFCEGWHVEDLIHPIWGPTSLKPTAVAASPQQSVQRLHGLYCYPSVQPLNNLPWRNDLPLSSLSLYRFNRKKHIEIIRNHQRHGAIVRSADGSQAARSDDPEAGSLTSPSAQGSAGCWVSGAFMSTGFSNVLQYGV